MRNISKTCLILPVVIAFNFELLASPLINKINLDDVDLFRMFFCGSTDFFYLSFLSVFLSIFPLLTFVVLFGTHIYDDLTVSGVYLFTRQASRSNWYLKAITRLAVYSVISSFLYSSACVYLTYGFTFAEYQFEIFLKLCVMSFIITFGFTLLQNLFSVTIGTIYGFFSVYALILIMLSTTLRMLKNDNVSFGAVAVNPFYALLLSIDGRLAVFDLFTCFIVIFIITIFGLLIIKYSDIGLINKELI